MKKVGLAAGFDQDRLKGLSHNYILSTARNQSNANFEDVPFATDDMQSMTCENPNLRAEITLSHPALINSELRLGLNAMIQRADAVNYWGEQTDRGRESLKIQSWTNEIALEAAWIKYWNAGIFNVHAGPGTNLGYTFSGVVSIDGEYLTMDEDNKLQSRVEASENGLLVLEDYDEYLRSKNAVHQRLYLTGGVGLTLADRLEISLDGRYGYGYRAIRGAGFQGTQLRSFGISAHWILN